MYKHRSLSWRFSRILEGESCRVIVNIVSIYALTFKLTENSIGNNHWIIMFYVFQLLATQTLILIMHQFKLYRVTLNNLFAYIEYFYLSAFFIFFFTLICPTVLVNDCLFCQSQRSRCFRKEVIFAFYSEFFFVLSLWVQAVDPTSICTSELSPIKLILFIFWFKI